MVIPAVWVAIREVMAAIPAVWAETREAMAVTREDLAEAEEGRNFHNNKNKSEGKTTFRFFTVFRFMHTIKKSIECFWKGENEINAK